MAFPLPAFDFSQILLWKDPEPPGRAEQFPNDAELLGLGLMSVVDLARGTRALPGRMWALNFLRPLTAQQVEAAIARVRSLTARPIFEIGPTPRRYFQAVCGEDLLRKRAWAAYPPGWQNAAAGTPLTLGSKSKIEIVVLDSGADVYHPALGNWISPLTQTPLEDLAQHGSHVVSTISGKAWGTAPPDLIQLADDYNVDFLPAGVLPANPLQMGNVAKDLPVTGDDGASVFEVDWVLYIQALNQLVGAPTTKDARILNLSLGGPNSSLLEQNLLAQIAGAKSLVVAAAGNHGAGDGATQVLYPAGYPECMAVGASSRDLYTLNFPAVPWDRSNDGLTAERASAGRSAIDVYAPGRNIVGALPVSLLNQSRPCGYKSGTSMATAFATGIFAVRLSRMSNLPPVLYSEAVTACKAKLPDLAGRGGHMVAVANFIGPL